MAKRLIASWHAAPRTVKVAVGALALSGATLPILTAVAYALDPEPLPDAGLTAAQAALALGVISAVAIGWMLLLSLLLLLRSRIGWLLAVGTGVLAVVRPQTTDLRLTDVVGYALFLAGFLPLLAPESLRWFWQRERTAHTAPAVAFDLRRPD